MGFEACSLVNAGCCWYLYIEASGRQRNRESENGQPCRSDAASSENPFVEVIGFDQFAWWCRNVANHRRPNLNNEGCWREFKLRLWTTFGE